MITSTAVIFLSEQTGDQQVLDAISSVINKDMTMMHVLTADPKDMTEKQIKDDRESFKDLIIGYNQTNGLNNIIVVGYLAACVFFDLSLEAWDAAVFKPINIPLGESVLTVVPVPRSDIPSYYKSKLKDINYGGYDDTYVVMPPEDFVPHAKKLIQLHKDGEIHAIGFDTETNSLQCYLTHSKITTVSVYDDYTKLKVACVFQHPQLFTPVVKAGCYHRLYGIMDEVVNSHLWQDRDRITKLVGDWLQEAYSLEGHPNYLTTSEREDDILRKVSDIFVILKNLKARSALDKRDPITAMANSVSVDLKWLLELCFNGVTPSKVMKLFAVIDELLNEVPIIGHNSKFDVRYLFEFNLGLQLKLEADSMLDASLLLGDVNGRLDLGTLANRYVPELGHWKDDMATDPRVNKKKHGKRYDRVELKKHGLYAAGDGFATFMVHKILTERSGDAEYLTNIRPIICRGIRQFCMAETHGFTVDMELLEVLKKVYNDRMTNSIEVMSTLPKAKEVLARLGAERVNPNVNGAGSHCANILFGLDGYALEPTGTTEAGYPSLDKEARAELKDQLKSTKSTWEAFMKSSDQEQFLRPAICANTSRRLNEDYMAHFSEADQFFTALTEYKDVSWLTSMYIDPVENAKKLNADPSIMHAEFNIVNATVTGRLSSGFHLMPKKSDAKKLLISAWNRKSTRQYRSMLRRVPGLRYQPLPRPKGILGGGVLIVGDYSQLEVFVIANLAGEFKLIKALTDGWDVHSYVASRIFKECEGLDSETIKTQFKSHRSAAKAIVFGLLYGKTPKTDEMIKLFAFFFAEFPMIKLWIENMHKMARELGYVETPFGRRRYLPDAQLPPNSHNMGLINAANRRAQNTPVQSTASDCAFNACTVIGESFENNNMYSMLLGGVHDSILHDIYPGELVPAFDIISDATMNIDYPFMNGNKLRFDLDMGVSWGRLIGVEGSVIKGDTREFHLKGGDLDLEMFLEEMRYAYDVDLVSCEDAGLPEKDLNFVPVSKRVVKAVIQLPNLRVEDYDVRKIIF
jgi:DNA polymerase I-like protein with 3'-5' exonuclease and polymerase domains